MTDAAQRYRKIIDMIKQCEQKYGREPGCVNLIAVSKTKPAEQIAEMAALGQRAFGENYLQEALSKQQLLKKLDLEWHFIGHIQSNKTQDIARHFDWVHGIDRFKIAQRLNDQRPENKAPLNLFLQVNLDAEQTKSGVSPDDVIDLAGQVASLPRVKLRGLMAIPSPNNAFDKQRSVFARLHELMRAVNRTGHALDSLSMGMTDDMSAAIAAGSTHVRIGTALFGPRHTSQTN